MMTMNIKPLTFAAMIALAATTASAQVKPENARVSATKGVAMPKSDRIPMVEFRKRMTAGDVVLIDVRSNSTYQNGHIPGALSMPNSTIEKATAQKLIQMGKLVVTYCACPAEHTAALAAQELQEQGVPAQALVGGWNQWVAEKSPIKTGPDAR